MNICHKYALPCWSLALVFIFVILLNPPIQAKENQTIYKWVAEKLTIPELPASPLVHFVSREDLQKTFRENNLNAYMSWATALGKVRADEIMNQYLEGVVGLFVPWTESIYVYADLPSCYRDAVLAHEYTHYLQHRLDNRTDKSHPSSDALHMAQELEAYKIEALYKERFCSNSS